MKCIIFDCDGTLLDVSERLIKPYQGIVDLLKLLSDDGFSLKIWTGRDRTSLYKYMRDLGLSQYFDDYCCAEDSDPKPNITGLIKLSHGFVPKEIAIIGDSWTDMQGAKKFGAIAIGANWNPSSSSSVLKEFGADFLVNKPLDCYKIIKQFSKN